MLPHKIHLRINMEIQKAASDFSGQLRILRNLRKSIAQWGGVVDCRDVLPAGEESAPPLALQCHACGRSR
jgi:hypothetical protein